MGLDNFLNDRIEDKDTFRYTILDILQLRSECLPGETAYIYLPDGEDEEERISYSELDRAARNIALQLIQNDLRGERALMLFPPGLEFIKALFGCFYAGVIATPAYPPRKNRSLERIRLMVVDSGASIVLTTNNIRQSFERSFSDVEELKKLTWLSTYDPGLPAPQLPSFPATAPSDIALLQYTSGSTGHPKGVIVTHCNIMRNLEMMRQIFDLSKNSISVTWLPCFHDNGLIDGILVPMYVGFPCISMPPVAFLQKPLRWLTAISKYKATHSGAPNFAFDYCINDIAIDELMGITLSSIKNMYSGAEPIRKKTLQQFGELLKKTGFDPAALHPAYGMAETTLIISGPHRGRYPVYLGLSGKALEQNKIIPASAGDPDCRYLVGVGYPWLDTEVKIVNPETQILCKNDEVGEIWVSGSIVTKGYWNKPVETARVYHAQIKVEPGKKYFRTGDLGFIHKGELFISGRLKDLIIIHGRNYYPQDIEDIVENSHPALRSSASAAFSIISDNKERLVIVAEVKRTALRNLDVEKVCNVIRQKIAEEIELAVHAILLLRTASILKTSSGKIQRKACKEGFLAKKLDAVGESVLKQYADQTESVNLNDELANIQAWMMVWIHTELKIPLIHIDLSKSISAYGLSSMKAVKLQQDFLNKYGIEFPPYLFFESISLKELSERAYNLIKEK